MPAAPTVTVAVYDPPLVSDTSKPVGGVTRIPPSILVPLTLKLVNAEAVPTFVDSAAGVPEVAITGIVQLITWIVPAT